MSHLPETPAGSAAEPTIAAQTATAPRGSPRGEAGRLTNIDIFRGLAALAVCVFHFNGGDFVPSDSLTSLTWYGKFGVDVFFVVSGFVIPLALERMNFRLHDTRVFLIARFLRLYPAYLAAGALAVALAYVSSLLPGFRGFPWPFTARQLLGNLFLTCDLHNDLWYIGASWTLAIEAQYYVLVAMSYPALVHSSPMVRYLTLLAWIVAPLIAGATNTVFSWTAVFAIGILCFWMTNRRTSIWALVPLSLLAAAAHAWVRGWPGGVIALLAAVGILLMPQIRSRALIAMGAISYSLYLLHVPVGGRVVTLSERFAPSPSVRFAVILPAILASVAAAAVFYLVIERPSHELSRKFSRKHRTDRG